MINNFMKPYFDPYINYKFSKEMEDKLDEILESKSPEEAKIDFLKDSYEKIQKHMLQNYMIFYFPQALEILLLEIFSRQTQKDNLN